MTRRGRLRACWRRRGRACEGRHRAPRDSGPAPLSFAQRSALDQMAPPAGLPTCPRRVCRRRPGRRRPGRGVRAACSGGTTSFAPRIVTSDGEPQQEIAADARVAIAVGDPTWRRIPPPPSHARLKRSAKRFDLGLRSAACQAEPSRSGPPRPCRVLHHVIADAGRCRS